MAASSGRARSKCLPCESHPQPQVLSQAEKLSELKSPSLHGSSQKQALAALKGLFHCVDELLHLPLAQPLLEALVDGSLRLLDVFGAARDAVSLMQQGLQALQSAIRRKSREEKPRFQSEVEAFMGSMKEMKRVTRLCLKNLKRTIEKDDRLGCSGSDSEAIYVVQLLREAEETGMETLESLVSFVCLPKPRPTRLDGLKMVSKLVLSKRVSLDGELDANEVEKMETQLLDLRSIKEIKNAGQVQMLLKELEAFKLDIKEMEEELGSVFRQLLKNRVSLLNALVDHGS